MKVVRNLIIVLLVIAVLYYLGAAFLIAIQGGHPS
jgi:hypothetical protein